MTIFKTMYHLFTLICVVAIIGIYVLYIALQPRITKQAKELYGTASKWKGISTFYRQRL